MPTDKRIVWKMPDGSFRYTTPAAPFLDGETELAYLSRVAARAKTSLPDLKDAVRQPDISDAEHAAIRSNRAQVR